MKFLVERLRNVKFLTENRCLDFVAEGRTLLLIVVDDAGASNVVVQGATLGVYHHDEVPESVEHERTLGNQARDKPES